MLIQFQDLKLKIVVVLFFFTAPSQLILFFKFDPTLSAHNYAPKTPNLKNYAVPPECLLLVRKMKAYVVPRMGFQLRSNVAQANLDYKGKCSSC